MSTFELKLDAFEGPLDLLLYLVNRHKLDIYDIEISLLLEQYLEYIDGMEQDDLDQAGDFLAMAARLVYIKTCSLLPRAEEAEALKKELEGELIEYSVCKEAAERLKGLCVYGDVFVRPPEKLPVNKVFTGTMDPQLLVKAYLGMSAKARSMKPIRAEQFKPIVAARIVTVTSKIVHVLKMLYTLGRCTVAELYEGVEDKSSRVATFLAVLELTKSGRIMLNDDNTEITFNRDAPRRRRERLVQEKPAEQTESPKQEIASAQEKEPAEEKPTPAAEHIEEPKPEAALPQEKEPAEEKPAPAAERIEEPKPEAALPQEKEPAEEKPVPAAERIEESKPEAALPQEKEPAEVKPAPAAEHIEEPKPEAALPQEKELIEEKPEPAKPRTAAAGKYAGAVKAASGATIALPTLVPLIITDSAPEAPAEPPAPEDPAPQCGESPDVQRGRPCKHNRFALRYYWGYPSWGNCLRYRRERL